MVFKKRVPGLVLMLGLLTTISPFSIDLYLPAFQKIADQLKTTPSRVSLTLASYFIGLALGQIFYGPLLDRFGRKKPLYFGLTLYVLASVGCLLANSIEILVFARFLQALGGCSASVGSTAMVRDFFPPEKSAKVFSRLMLVLSVSPLFAPTIGGWIAAAFGWRAEFLALAIIVTLFLLMVIFLLPEGHQPDPSVSLKVGSILKNFLVILKNRTFFSHAIPGAFSFAGLFTYLAGAPPIFLGKFQLSEKAFGLVFAFLSIGMVGGGQLNIWLMKRFSGEKIFRTALKLQAFIALIFVVGCFFEAYGFYAHVLIFFCFISCVGLTYPNAAALALQSFQKNIGSAAALLGTLQMGSGALAAAAFGLMSFAPSLSVAILFVLTSLAGLIVAILKGSDRKA